MKLIIRLNGTDENPWHKMGLRQNPFPQLAQTETDYAEHVLNSLDGDPIPDKAYIKEKLKGFGKELIDLCCEKFEKGKRVEFMVEIEG